MFPQTPERPPYGRSPLVIVHARSYISGVHHQYFPATISSSIAGLSMRQHLPPCRGYGARTHTHTHRLDPQAESDMRAMQVVMDLGRSARERRGISLKTPVKGITVVCKDEGTLKALEKLQSYVKGELNAWEVRVGRREINVCGRTLSVLGDFAMLLFQSRHRFLPLVSLRTALDVRAGLSLRCWRDLLDLVEFNWWRQ